MHVVGEVRPLLMREVLGESLRAARIAQGRTLRDISHAAMISLGYLSEIERGVKEASSELLTGIAAALDVPLSEIVADVSRRLELREAAAADDWVVLSRAA